MWLILQHDKPEDFVIATGVPHTVREFVLISFKYVGIQVEFRGEGVDEVAVEVDTGVVRVRVNKAFYRPTECVSLNVFSMKPLFLLLFQFFYYFFYSIQVQLLGDASKARKLLNWKPSTTFTVTMYFRLPPCFSCLLVSRKLLFTINQVLLLLNRIWSRT